jgi:hypothetical protein
MNLRIDTLIQCGVLSLGLAAVLSLFITLKRETGALTRRHTKELYELREHLQRTELRIETLPKERSTEGSRIQAQPGINFNLTRRVQALRLLRRGEDIGHVAAVLGVPRGEIELLVRVQKLGAARLAGRS